VLDGDHIGRRFPNEDIREPIFGPPKSLILQRRASAAVGRLLKSLHLRQLVANIPRTRRWRVTQRGRRLLGLATVIYNNAWPQLAAGPRINKEETSPHLA
jgi:hypothetical protein